MQRSEHQVTGFSRGQCQADRFEVAQFADENDVRVFTQRRTQGIREGVCLWADLALVDQAFLGVVYEFDRVFDRQDMRMLVFVDVVDHRRQRRRFAGACRPSNENDAARIFGNILENFGTVEFFERQHLGRNRPENRACAAILHEGIDPEARQVGDLEGKIAFEIVFIVLALRIVHDVIDHRVHFLVRHGWQIDAAHVAVYANHWRQTRREVQVGSLVLDAKGQQFGDVHRYLPR